MRDRKDKIEELERIASHYHLSAEQPDLFIENACQEHCCDWIEQSIAAQSLVLELGFGDGIVTARISKQARQYDIVEGSAQIAAIARQAYPEAQVFHELFEHFMPPLQYDYIVAGHVLEHVDSPVELLRRMRGWLKPEGRIIVVVPNAESIHRQLAVLLGIQPELDSLSPRDELVGHQRVYDAERIRAYFAEAGYRVEEERGFFLKALPNGMMLEYSAELIDALNRISAELPPRMLANLGFVIAADG